MFQGYVGNLVFQNFNLLGIAKDLTGESECDYFTFTMFHEIYEDTNNIQTALGSPKGAREFGGGPSLWKTFTNMGFSSRKGYTKLS